ncbi:MAG: ArsR/SmtB family transcription factor [Desulfovibrio sp.]|uniref:ArsR/SmtB family transcription factor n=1 Tax=Desulfovibrio sp. 7SRBS1 TaxID=3378064 RepID=UPI003B401846
MSQTTENPGKASEELPEDAHCFCNDHHEAVALARRSMASDESIERAAEMFKAMGDPNRLRILAALAAVTEESERTGEEREDGELCVCALCDLLGLSQSSVSHQLRLLRAMRLVKGRKQGKWVYYSLDDDHVKTLMAQGLCHAANDCSS